MNVHSLLKAAVFMIGLSVLSLQLFAQIIQSRTQAIAVAASCPAVTALTSRAVGTCPPLAFHMTALLLLPF